MSVSFVAKAGSSASLRSSRSGSPTAMPNDDDEFYSLLGARGDS